VRAVVVWFGCVGVEQWCQGQVRRCRQLVAAQPGAGVPQFRKFSRAVLLGVYRVECLAECVEDAVRCVV
jgi:hypothetical protein